MEQTQLSIFDRLNIWFRESIVVKLFSIGFLVLLLLIPASWLESIIKERQERATEVVNEVANKWSGDQQVSGPVLVLPFKKITKFTKDDREDIVESREEAFFLPEDLKMNTNIKPQQLNRGIFDVVVYNSDFEIKGNFTPPNLDALQIPNENVLWDQAYLIFGISDLRGIVENPQIQFGNESFSSEPDQNASVLFRKNISAKLNLKEAITSSKDFTVKLALKGSGKLSFLPMGKSTQIKAEGNWGNPSFTGAYLPINRDVKDSLFTAEWKVLHFNRSFPQQWVGHKEDLSDSSFGLDLLMPVDQYQMTLRTAKYGILIILLTFIALLMIEIICKVRIHPFQYILIGAALIIYYTLLLSLSEHDKIGYNLAYLIASSATVILISLYSTSFLPNKKIVALLTFLLVVFYSFIFTITQSQDYALLLGSIGLFLIVGILMYVSRKISWYGESKREEVLS
jgi:inner membrane protein